MDNATAEYSFIARFFSQEPPPPPVASSTVRSGLISPGPLSPDEGQSTLGTDLNGPLTPTMARRDSIVSTMSTRAAQQNTNGLSKEDVTALTTIWKQVMDPALDHAQVSYLSTQKISLAVSSISCVALSEIHPNSSRARPTRHSTADYDPSDRRNHVRSPKTELPSTGDGTLWHSTANVAVVPESYDGAGRCIEEAGGRRCRWVCWVFYEEDRDDGRECFFGACFFLPFCILRKVGVSPAKWEGLSRNRSARDISSCFSRSLCSQSRRKRR